MPMTADDLAAWGRTRARGRPRFLLVQGLQFGVGCLMLGILVASLGWPDGVREAPSRPIAELALLVAGGAVGGLLCAWQYWSLSETAYRKAFPGDVPS